MADQLSYHFVNKSMRDLTCLNPKAFAIPSLDLFLQGHHYKIIILNFKTKFIRKEPPMKFLLMLYITCASGSRLWEFR